MPQMTPMIWLLTMMMTLAMITLTIITIYFTTTEVANLIKPKKVKTIKWKW